MPRRTHPGWLRKAPPSRAPTDTEARVAVGAGPDPLLPLTEHRPGASPGPRASALLVLSGLFAAQLAQIVVLRGGWSTAPVLVLAVAIFGLQLSHAAPSSRRWPSSRRLSALLAQGIITYLPLVILREEWPGLVGFLAGSVLMLLPGRISWAPFTGVIASMPLGSIWLGMSARVAVLLTFACLSTGLTVFGICRLWLASDRAHAASTQLAQATAVRERERFSRDLHDILGHSMSAITLKAELTRRLVTSDPPLARIELEEVADLARQASADVRVVASGYRNVSLATEAASAASVLLAANIMVQIEMDFGAIDDKVDAVLATVLREAVTNVLRHSTARLCAIKATRTDDVITLAVTNDGVPRTAASRTSGSGLENLAWRLEAIGGELVAGVHQADRFGLLATVPLSEESGRIRHDPR